MNKEQPSTRQQVSDLEMKYMDCVFFGGLGTFAASAGGLIYLNSNPSSTVYTQTVLEDTKPSNILQTEIARSKNLEYFALAGVVIGGALMALAISDRVEAFCANTHMAARNLLKSKPPTPENKIN